MDNTHGRALFWVIVTSALIGTLAFTVSTCHAHDAAAMTDQKRNDWFTSLKTPNGSSCCNLTDCKQSEARQLPDQSWEAKIGDKWWPIPPEKVLKNPKSIDGEAYLCHSNYLASPIIYCFVPPIPGY